MKKEQLYFSSIDDTHCYNLADGLNDAKIEGLEVITLIEAIPDNENPDYIFCSYYGEVGERQECRKSFCPHYASKSGRGKCSNKGNLYVHGEEVTFKVL